MGRCRATTPARSSRSGRPPGTRPACSAPSATRRGRSTTCSRCSPIRRGASTWGTCATTRWATWSRATSARAASTCCTRWAGTPSACRPRTPRSRRACTRPSWTYQNIAAMRAQMQPLGLSIDWSREFATCDPEYYGQQQALFLDMLEAGLVARKAAVVNWDPVDMTVLANEQVIDGKGWRSGAPVERRELTQWFFRITDMADELLDAIDGLDALAGEGAPDAAQLDRQEPRPAVPLRDQRGAGGLRDARGLHHPARHALGRELRRGLARPSAGEGAGGRTRRSPPSSPSAAQLGTSEEEIETAEKRGIDTGIRVVHPLDPASELPVWIANFILMDYGTGAIFGCPAHDQRDLDFVRKYGLPVIDVFAPRGSEARVEDDAFVPPKTEPVDYLRPVAGARADDRRGGGRARRSTSARRAASARASTKFRLRDWGICAAALLGLPDPGAALPGLRHRAGGAREPAGAAARGRELRPARATRSSGTRPGRRATCPRCGGAGAARDRHDGHLRRLRAGTSRASPRRTPRRRPTWPTPTTG